MKQESNTSPKSGSREQSVAVRVSTHVRPSPRVASQEKHSIERAVNSKTVKKIKDQVTCVSCSCKCNEVLPLQKYGLLLSKSHDGERKEREVGKEKAGSGRRKSERGKNRKREKKNGKRERKGEELGKKKWEAGNWGAERRKRQKVEEERMGGGSRKDGKREKKGRETGEERT